MKANGQISAPDRDGATLAERYVLGAILRDGAVISDLVQFLRYDDFRRAGDQELFRAVVDLHDQGKPVDLASVADELQRRQQVANVGGYSYLAELWDACPTAANAEYHARKVHDDSICRRLHLACDEINIDIDNHTMPAEELLATAEKRIFELSMLGGGGAAVPLSVAVSEAADRFDARALRGSQESGIPTGFTDLDTMTAGLQDSELIIIAARPSAGKTSLALALVRNILLSGRSVFFASLEQSRVELAERLMASQGRIDGQHLRNGRVDAGEKSRLSDAVSVLRKLPMHIDDWACQSMLRISANARRLKMKHQIQMVVIDYLQLVQPDDSRVPRHEQVAAISRRMKHLARELKVPVVALAQLNRAVEGRADGVPKLSDLRECVRGDTLVVDAITGLHVRVDQLKPGQSILGLGSDQIVKPGTVDSVWSTGTKPVFHLVTSSGRRIVATANHPFLTDRGWVELDKLDRVNDRIAVPLKERVGSNVAWDKIRGIESCGSADVYDLIVPEINSFIASGIVVHNSGSIEADADTVMLLHKPGDAPDCLDIHIAKQRNGPTGAIRLYFRKEYMRFENFHQGMPE